MITTENEKAMVEYWVPRETTVRSAVNILRNAGINGILRIVITTPCMIPKSMPWVVALFAFAIFFAPR